MRFLVDAQLPPALTRWLEAKGHKADHVQDVRLLHAEDAEIWNYTLSIDAVIVTKEEEDFSVRAVTSPPGPPVVWIHLGNATNRALLDRLDPLWPEIERALHRGEKLIEVV